MIEPITLLLPEATIANLHALARKRDQRLGDLLRDLVTDAYV